VRLQDLLVYVAGPIGDDPMHGARTACLAGADLLEAGLTPVVPQLSVFWDFLAPRPYEEWIAYDLCVLARCDALLRLKGESPGADQEVAFAEARGIPVFHSKGVLYAWAKERCE